MSRIRSIHPGFFTDEDIVSVSMAARMLMIGIGVEADDKGVFEWKPITIKMRLFPADNIDVAALLEELAQVGLIRRYEAGGKAYGAIKNFRKFQRPKTPNSLHPAPHDILIYVGLEKPNSETPPANQGQVPPKVEENPDNEAQFPQLGEMLPQMEDGGGRREEETPLPPKGADEAESEILDEVGQLVATWNKVADIHDLPVVRKITDTRRRSARKRIAEHGLAEMQECVGRIACSPFLSGNTPENFRADFDFLLTPSKLTRLQEGFYDERQRDPPPVKRHGTGTVAVIGDFAKRIRA